MHVKLSCRCEYIPPFYTSACISLPRIQFLFTILFQVRSIYSEMQKSHTYAICFLTKSTYLWNPSPRHDLEHPPTPERPLVPHPSEFLPLPPHQKQSVFWYFFYCTLVLSFTEFSINGIVQYMLFCIRLRSPGELLKVPMSRPQCRRRKKASDSWQGGWRAGLRSQYLKKNPPGDYSMQPILKPPPLERFSIST